jgi:hypothetical protein
MVRMPKPTRTSSWTWFDVGLASLAVVAVGLLVLSYVRPQSPHAPPTLGQLAEQVEGKTLHSITYLADDSGGVGTVDFAVASTTILLIFQPGCSVCDANHPNWIAVEERVERRPDLRVVAVTTGGPRSGALSWLAERGLQADAVVIPTVPAVLRTDWHLFGVPATYVVDRTGRVSLARFGTLTSGDIQQILEITQQEGH